jgi:hypothetical protein
VFLILQVGTRQRKYPQCMIYKSIAVQDGLRDDLLSQAVSTKVLGFINAGCEAGELSATEMAERSAAAARDVLCPHTYLQTPTWISAHAAKVWLSCRH